MEMKKAYFAGGCFWCITPAFELEGVEEIVSGYSGGEEINPTYEAVKHQETGHRETVEVCYDCEKVDFEQLMELFLGNIDPFDGGGQFIDRGHSYTLAVYYQDENEKTAAEAAIRKLEQSSGKQVCIVVEPFLSFYPAEEYHQDYHHKNPEAFERELISSGRKQLSAD